VFSSRVEFKPFIASPIYQGEQYTLVTKFPRIVSPDGDLDRLIEGGLEGHVRELNKILGEQQERTKEGATP